MPAIDCAGAIREAEIGDIPALTRILNAEIVGGTASWTVTPRSERAMADWLSARRSAGFPVLVFGRPVVGYASYGPFRQGEGYAGIAEHSVYVDRSARRRGIARALRHGTMKPAH